MKPHRHEPKRNVQPSTLHEAPSPSLTPSPHTQTPTTHSPHDARKGGLLLGKAAHPHLPRNVAARLAPCQHIHQGGLQGGSWQAGPDVGSFQGFRESVIGARR